MNQVSILLTSFERAPLLRWGLYSLARQHIPFPFETIVINDGLPDETEMICGQYHERLNLRYIFSGQRNLGGAGIRWRVPGFALNIGAHSATGRVIILSCAEIFHLNETIAQLVQPILENNTLITVPIGKDDRDGSFLHQLASGNGSFDPNTFWNYPELNVRLPFLLAVERAHFYAIRGYDEDFTGIAFDDNDLVDRLVAYGCKYLQTQAQAIHLYHPRYVYQVGESPEWHYNRNLYLSRQGRLVRNENREWGRL